MIYNLTQHDVTEDQKAENIIDVEDKEYVRNLLTFDDLPDDEIINNRAVLLAEYADKINAKEVMIGGALYLMPPLIKELRKKGIIPYYSFSKRISFDEHINGSVIKRTCFRHVGLIEAKV